MRMSDHFVLVPPLIRVVQELLKRLTVEFLLKGQLLHYCILMQDFYLGELGDYVQMYLNYTQRALMS